MGTKIRSYLKRNNGKYFTTLGIFDESLGRWVKNFKILNKHFVRHLKVELELKESSGQIAKFLYHDCKDLIDAHGFWTNHQDQKVFYYSWKHPSKSFNDRD